MKKLLLFAVMLFGLTAFSQTQEELYKKAYANAETTTSTTMEKLVVFLKIKDDKAVQQIKEVLFEKNLYLAQYPDFSMERKTILAEKVEGVFKQVLTEEQFKMLKSEEEYYKKILY